MDARIFIDYTTMTTTTTTTTTVLKNEFFYQYLETLIMEDYLVICADRLKNSITFRKEKIIPIEKEYEFKCPIFEKAIKDYTVYKKVTEIGEDLGITLLLTGILHQHASKTPKLIHTRMGQCVEKGKHFDRASFLHEGKSLEFCFQIKYKGEDAIERLEKWATEDDIRELSLGILKMRFITMLKIIARELKAEFCTRDDEGITLHLPPTPVWDEIKEDKYGLLSVRFAFDIVEDEKELLEKTGMYYFWNNKEYWERKCLLNPRFLGKNVIQKISEALFNKWDILIPLDHFPNNDPLKYLLGSSFGKKIIHYYENRQRFSVANQTQIEPNFRTATNIKGGLSKRSNHLEIKCGELMFCQKILGKDFKMPKIGHPIQIRELIDGEDLDRETTLCTLNPAGKNASMAMSMGWKTKFTGEIFRKSESGDLMSNDFLKNVLSTYNRGVENLREVLSELARHYTDKEISSIDIDEMIKYTDNYLFPTEEMKTKKGLRAVVESTD